MDVQAQALIETLAKLLPGGGDRGSWRNSGRCGGRSSGRHFSETLTKAKYKMPLDTLCNVEAEAQVDTVVDTLNRG